MAIIALKAWYLPEYEPLQEVENRLCDLRLSKKSLLKSALRADFLEDSEHVKQTNWFRRYLDGETIEFYIEGSGSYTIANIDLISHEVYFTKQDGLTALEPTLFFCYQSVYSESSQLLRDEIKTALEKFNERSRLPVLLEESDRLTDSPIRLNSSLMRKIRKCMVFVADGTPILQLEGSPPQLIPCPKVCVEVGYALQCKRAEQLVLATMERPDVAGQFPFDVPSRDRLSFRHKTELRKQLPAMLEAKFRRFNLTQRI